MIEADNLVQAEALVEPASDRWIHWGVRALELMTAAMVLFIMGLTFVDVFCRYLFATPIKGSAEMVKFAMAILVFSAFPIVTYREEHISVGLTQGKLSGSARWLQRFFVLAVSALACGTMAWQLARNGSEMIADDVVTMVLGWKLGYLNYFMSIQSLVACAAIFGLLLLHIGGASHASSEGQR